MKLKEEKYKEIYSMSYHDQIAEYQWWRKKMSSCQRGKHIKYKEQRLEW